MNCDTRITNTVVARNYLIRYGAFEAVPDSVPSSSRTRNPSRTYAFSICGSDTESFAALPSGDSA